MDLIMTHGVCFLSISTSLWQIFAEDKSEDIEPGVF